MENQRERRHRLLWAPEALYSIPRDIKPPENARPIQREALRSEARFYLRQHPDHQPAFIGFYIGSVNREVDEERRRSAQAATDEWCRRKRCPPIRVRRLA